MAKRKLVVFTSRLSWSVCAGIASIAQAIPQSEWLVVVHSPPRRAVTLLRNQWRNIRRNGLRWLLYQANELRHRLLRRDGRPISPDLPGYSRTLSPFRDQVRVRHVADLHADATLDEVRAFAPDVGLSIAAPILRRPLFSIPKLGTLNLHKGRVPDYRGMPPAFWELWNNEQSVGCTVHWIDDRLDTGDVVLETTLSRERYSTLRGMQLRLDEAGIALMRQAVLDVLERDAHSQPQSAGGRTYRKPTLAQFAELDRRLARTEPKRGTWPRRALKEAVFLGANAVAYGPLRPAISPRISVLLYHGVSDAIRDNLTVGIAQFDRQMCMLRERCVIRSIEEVVALSELSAAPKPQVCVTFDDGYLDNYEYAAPILERYGIPATFFVSTGFMGTERQFPHDVRRNRKLPTMNWDQLRDLVSRGFTIGSHSINHINCAAEPEDVVKKELLQSLADIRRELNISRVLFAYPFGGREHMTPERLALVKNAGYIGCLSAYGGSNVGKIDPFNVRRYNVNWLVSDRAFLFRCSGLA